MKRLVWKLGRFLAENHLTAYHLESKLRAMLALEGTREMPFSPSTIYKWAKAEAVPERIQTATFERIHRALEDMLSRDIELSELLSWEEQPAQAPAKAQKPAKTPPRRTPSGTREKR